MLSLPYKLYRNKFHVPPLPPPGSLQDKRVLITGGNTGLGLAAAVHCLNLGASLVIITSRDAARGEAARQEIERQRSSGGSGDGNGGAARGTLKVLPLDMGTLAGVREFVEVLKKEVGGDDGGGGGGGGIDFALLNAGVRNLHGAVSEDGWENTLQVNVLSTALLGVLLLPWMKASVEEETASAAAAGKAKGNGKGKAHLAIVGSGLHRGVQISEESGWPWGDGEEGNVLRHWNEKEVYTKAGAGRMYAVSKLLVTYVMRELAELGRGSDGSPQVIVNAVCPGMCKSELARESLANPIMNIVGNVLMTALLKSSEGGARSLIYAALTTHAETGRSFAHYQTDEEYRAETEKNIWGDDGQKMQRKVWKEVVDVLAAKVPAVKEIVD